MSITFTHALPSSDGIAIWFEADVIHARRAYSIKGIAYPAGVVVHVARLVRNNQDSARQAKRATKYALEKVILALPDYMEVLRKTPARR